MESAYNMNVFKEPYSSLVDVVALKKEVLNTNKNFELSGCINAVKPSVINALKKKQTIVITRDDIRARELLDSYKGYSDDGVIFPAKDVIFYQSDIRGNALVRERIYAIEKLLSDEDITCFVSVDALMNCMPKPASFGEKILTTRVEEKLDLEEWKKTLVLLGYESVVSTEHPGEFSVRGGIIDIFPLVYERPVRIELWGDEVDSIRSFSPENQTSIEKIDEVIIGPASEIIISADEIIDGLNRLKEDFSSRYETLRKEFKTEEAHRLKTTIERISEEIEEGWGSQEIENNLPYFMEDTCSILDYFDDDAIVIYDDARNFKEELDVKEKEFVESMTRRIEKGYTLPKQLQMIKTSIEVLSKVDRYASIVLSTLDTKVKGFKIDKRFYINVLSISDYNSSFETLVKDLLGYKKNKYKVIITSASRTKANRLAKDLLERDLNAFYSEDQGRKINTSEVMVTVASIEKGFIIPECGFVLISENDIFGTNVTYKKKRRKIYDGEKFNSLSELNIGDYVVHENHGVGIYRGLEKIEVDKIMKDYIRIEYAKKGNLYILATQFDMIQKYGNADGKKPKLNTLGTTAWSKTKSGVKEAVGQVAKELVDLYSHRQQNNGYKFDEDTIWQKEFEETFPYEETSGQLEAIEAVKSDMESDKIMDRLICGDVGYGKTEIAIRAAFKAAQENKQVVVLCPTTILCKQHYNTFVQRMKEYPINIDLLCRFRSDKEQKETIKKLKNGNVDILIGTHRALSKDVEYKDLGLLVIDEEQRFGVNHKEKIKALKKNVDVLCLSATPIPRTLHMSLVGIRDMSVLEEAPVDRMPIQTFVFEYNEEMVRDAILREIHRGGQVYYVYNRINTIADITAKIESLVPEVNVKYAHGRMSESRLEDIMNDFVEGSIDVLVSTTIIEIGIDIPNVNTMIIHDAENLGLSQLYQLRGRIGRSNRMAYAFFMYKKDKVLKEVAEKRLAAIKEFSDLGSGFKIALRDLEIRGAGNMLGKEQHGHLEAVGYDLYCKMLNNAVKAEKGIEEIRDYETTIDLNIDAFIPPSYIENEVHKLDIYKRIAEIGSESDYDVILDELIDRFGDPPKSVLNLLFVSLIKCEASNSFVTEIIERGNVIHIYMYQKAKIDADKMPALLEKHYPYITFSANKTAPEFLFNTKANSKLQSKDVHRYLFDFIRELNELKQNN